MGKALSITFNKENCGRLKNWEIICGKFVGRPGREALDLPFFGVGCFRAARRFGASCFVSPTPPERY